MKKYENPELEIVRFDDADIITTSQGCVPGMSIPNELEEENM